MKIDAYGSGAAESAQVFRISDAMSGSRSAPANSVQLHAEDTASLASGVASVQALTDSSFGAAARADKVASLRQAVQSGQYTVDPARIAAALSKADI